METICMEIFAVISELLLILFVGVIFLTLIRVAPHIILGGIMVGLIIFVITTLPIPIVVSLVSIGIFLMLFKRYYLMYEKEIGKAPHSPSMNHHPHRRY